MPGETSASRLLHAALERLQPHLPDGVSVKISTHRGWTTLQRTNPETIEIRGHVHQVEFDNQGRPQSTYFGGITVGKRLGSWMPLLPGGLRRRLAAQNAVEILLKVSQPLTHPDRPEPSIDYDVRTRTTAAGVVVSYRPPSAVSRIELPAFPASLFQSSR